jgi:hypothetical protein
MITNNLKNKDTALKFSRRREENEANSKSEQHTYLSFTKQICEKEFDMTSEENINS